MELQTFAFKGNEVRIIVGDDNEPRFVLNDLCRILGLSNPSAVAKRIDPDALSQAYPIVDSMGRTQHPTVVDEAGMYEVVLRSDKPHAVEFRRWLTREVLPSIRKHGGYLTPEATKKALEDPDFIIGLATKLKEEQERAAELAAKTVQQQVALEQAAPKVDYHDRFISEDSDLFTIRDIAGKLQVQESWLRDMLVKYKWIYAKSYSRFSNKAGKVVSENLWYACADKKQYFDPIYHYEKPRLAGQVRRTLKVKPEGALAISKAVNRWRLETGEGVPELDFFNEQDAG